MERNVLIVDDSPIDRKIIRTAISKKLESIYIFEAENGLDIESEILKNHISVCILDIMLPGKNGFEILKEIKEDHRLSDIPIIVCTGINHSEGVEKALTLGAYDFFSKPLKSDEIKISLPLKVKNAIDFVRRKEEILYLSYHDKLTGLYNRRFYEEEVNMLDNKENFPLTVIIGDVNGLKLINDAFGHQLGDRLLQTAADSIKEACRTEDIVARWGGDEFIILLSKTSAEDAQEIVKRIKIRCTQKWVSSLNLSISFGWDSKTKEEENINDIVKRAEDNMYQNKLIEYEGVRGNIINTIINVLNEKNPREKEHSRRVSELCQEIGRAIGLSDTEVNQIKTEGLLHDIGKIAIDEKILNKPGKLTDEEMKKIRLHPEIGYRILTTSNEMLSIANCVVAHHEKWDGTGYPKGLKGEAIPVHARIIALADCYDAMISERPYRNSFTLDQVCQEIRKNAGQQFDAGLARIFIEKVLKRQWEEIEARL